MTKKQGSPYQPVVRAECRPWALLRAALEADLILRLALEHLKQSLVAQAAPKAEFSWIGRASAQFIHSPLERNLAH